MPVAFEGRAVAALPSTAAGVAEVSIAGTRLQLLPERAAYLPDQGCLLVADAHLGKAHSFRRLGVPVPGGTTGETLARLSAAVARSGARQLVFLGDLLHSAHAQAANTHAAFTRWRELHADLQLTLVRGNHDKHAGDPPAAWRVQAVAEPLVVGGLSLQHHPEILAAAADPASPARYVLAGHVHPAVVLRGRSPGRLRLPCFHFGPRIGILPAFGAFTGMHQMRRTARDCVYVVTDDSVRLLPTLAADED